MKNEYLNVLKDIFGRCFPDYNHILHRGDDFFSFRFQDFNFSIKATEYCDKVYVSISNETLELCKENAIIIEPEHISAGMLTFENPEQIEALIISHLEDLSKEESVSTESSVSKNVIHFNRPVLHIYDDISHDINHEVSMCPSEGYEYTPEYILLSTDKGVYVFKDILDNVKPQREYFGPSLEYNNEYYLYTDIYNFVKPYDEFVVEDRETLESIREMERKTDFDPYIFSAGVFLDHEIVLEDIYNNYPFDFHVDFIVGENKYFLKGEPNQKHTRVFLELFAKGSTDCGSIDSFEIPLKDYDTEAIYNRINKVLLEYLKNG